MTDEVWPSWCDEHGMIRPPGPPKADLVLDQVYTAYALVSRGREEIERYVSVREAVQDMLELWPEDDDGDVTIEDNQARVVVYFSRSTSNPRIVHLYFMAPTKTGIDHVESYKCEYEPALGGSVRTSIKRLG